MNPRAEQMERRLEWPMLVAALLIVPVVAIEQSDLGDPWETVATVLNWVSWTAFLVEAVLMLRVVDDRWGWIRNHPLEVAVIVLTPPFLPASLQAARAFRLLRLVRAVVVARRLLTTEGVRDTAVLAAMTVLGGGAAYASVEGTTPSGDPLSTWDGVWWAITTVTTVGYGDNYPSTTGGRLIAMGVMTVGIGFVAILTAAAVERFAEAGRAKESELARTTARLDEIIRRLESLERR